MSIAKQLLKSMRRFMRNLKRGGPIVATRIERHATPDGPLHVRRKVVLFGNTGGGK